MMKVILTNDTFFLNPIYQQITLDQKYCKKAENLIRIPVNNVIDFTEYWSRKNIKTMIETGFFGLNFIIIEKTNLFLLEFKRFGNHLF